MVTFHCDGCCALAFFESEKLRLVHEVIAASRSGPCVPPRT